MIIKLTLKYPKLKDQQERTQIDGFKTGILLTADAFNCQVEIEEERMWVNKKTDNFHLWIIIGGIILVGVFAVMFAPYFLEAVK